MFMNTKVTESDISFLQLSDSFFPTGMYTMSNGLEALFYRNKKLSYDVIKDLIQVSIKYQIGPVDCCAISNAYTLIETKDYDALKQLDNKLYFMRLVQETREASVRSGVQLIKCVKSFVTSTTDNVLEYYNKCIQEKSVTGIYPISFAVCCHSLNISKDKSALMLLYGYIVSVIGAALRLGVIQHYDGQKIIHDLQTDIITVIKENINKPVSDMWQFIPGLEIVQMYHEQMDSKMFIT